MNDFVLNATKGQKGRSPKGTKNMNTADAIIRTLESDIIDNPDGEPRANVVEVLAYIAASAENVAKAITPNAAPGTGANNGHISSLTEAVMDASHSLNNIANAIDNLADAVRTLAMNNAAGE